MPNKGATKPSPPQMEPRLTIYQLFILMERNVPAELPLTKAAEDNPYLFGAMLLPEDVLLKLAQLRQLETLGLLRLALVGPDLEWSLTTSGEAFRSHWLQRLQSYRN